MASRYRRNELRYRRKERIGAAIAVVALGMVSLVGARTAFASFPADGTPSSVTNGASAANHSDGAVAIRPKTRVVLLKPLVRAEIPHDTTAFTEGFEIADGVLYESTGLDGRSQLRELEPATGAVLRSVPLPDKLFGEGITVVGDRIWQLTFTEGVVLEWDRRTLTVKRQLHLTGQGWGLCYDGTRLIRSDGTPVLRFYDPDTFAPLGSMTITVNGVPLTRESPLALVNELECDNGQIYANLWRTNQIMRIDGASGATTAFIDATDLVPNTSLGPEDVLNGIASLADKELLLTGKRWPITYRVRLVNPCHEEIIQPNRGEMPSSAEDKQGAPTCLPANPSSSAGP